MFSIYGISGPIFQGTLENLSQVQPVQRSRPVGAVRRIGDETTIQPQTGGPAAASPGEQAISAYQQMLPHDLERGPLYHANQIMQPEVITLNADDEVAHAWRTLVKHRIHQAPVVDASHHLVGIVSERNLLTTLNVDGGEVRDVLFRVVRDVMTTPVVAAAPLTDIRRIARVMLERDVDGVPIVNETGRLVGFVSRSDILNAIVTDPPLSIWR